MKKVVIVRSSVIGAADSEGGKFSAICEDHNQFVQGTRKSLEGRYTFEICEYCELPEEAK